ncbi:carotenoid ester lipase precursor [Cytidiella melzeri]|nr:carotenoid ester lipase precursor [Cytidiella melzeri]
MHTHSSYSSTALTVILAASPVFTTSIVGAQVQLDQGTFIGIHNGSTDRFLGIPFAKPPTGDLRFRLPVANDPYTGVLNATSFGLACPQQAMQYAHPTNLAPEVAAIVSAPLDIPDAGEDCLSINIWQPSGLPRSTKLPVVIWIYGGTYTPLTIGCASFDGGVIVQRSIELGEPIIHASLNHRQSVFGFAGGAEVKAAGVGNLGLHDQRQAFRWVQKYISAFNGDASKVTIWGESSGAISVALQIIANGGDNEGLFRGAFMQSGSPIPYGEITQGQRSYDQFVLAAGCQNATDSLQCLREAPYKVLQDAMNVSPSILSRQSLNSSWAPSADGVFLLDPPQHAVLKGTVANIPFVSGDCDDEGTLFSLSQFDVTTAGGASAYVASNYFPNATAAEIDLLLDVYPQNVTQGSPFGTGTANVVYPEYKRLAAFQGDLVFSGPRRFFMQQRSDKQPVWGFLSKRMKATPDLGSYHGHDVANVYGPGELTDYLVHFVNHLNPNGNGSERWPRYTPANPALMTLLDGPTPQAITQDTFRDTAMSYLTSLSLKYPL